MRLPIISCFQDTEISDEISYTSLHDLHSKILDEYAEAYHLDLDPPVFNTDKEKQKFKKTRLPAFLPADLIVKNQRGDAKNIAGVTLLCVDVDLPADHARIEETLQLNGWEYICYPTISCTDVQVRKRYILKPTKTPKPSEIGIIHRYLFVVLGGLPDSACWDPARIHAVPYRIGGRERLKYSGGKPVDVDEILAHADELQAIEKTKAPEIFDKFRLHAVVKWEGMRGGKKEYYRPAVQMLKAVLGDGPFPKEGQRDTSATRLAQALKHTPELADWEVRILLYHAREVVEREWTDEPWSTFEDKFDRLYFSGDHFDDPTASFDPVRKAQAQNEGGVYSPEQLEAHAAQPRIVMVGGHYYVRKILDDNTLTYAGPWSGAAAVTAVRCKLAPDPEVDFMRVNSQGNLSQKSLSALVEEYGVVTTSVKTELDLMVEGVTYREGSLLECLNPYRRDIEPRRDEVIENWAITAFGSDFFDNPCRATVDTPSGRFVSWLARFPDLTLPLTMLYLSGPPKTGKNLLAKGLCRYWTDDPDPAPLDGRILSSGFQDPLTTDPPLVFLNEEAPKGLTLDDLKKQIEATERSVNRKHLPEAKLRGAARFLAADNNRDILRALTDERGHSSHSSLAASDRFTMLDMNESAARYLEMFGKNELEDIFIRRDGMISYALWWAQNFDRALVNTTRARFGVMPDPDEARTAALLTSVTGIGGRTIEALVSLLADPRAALNVSRKEMLIYSHKDQILCVSIPTFRRRWKDLTGDSRVPPSTVTIARAFDQLRAHGVKETVRVVGLDGKQKLYFPLEASRLKAYVNESLSDSFSWEDCERGLEGLKRDVSGGGRPLQLR